MLDLVENKFDEAELALQENRAVMRSAAQPDAALLELTEFALAAVAFQRQSAVKEELREYTTAEQRYLGALQHYPDSAEAARARFSVGQSYWFIATQKSKALNSGSLNDEERKAYQKQYAEYLQKASEQFDKIEELLLARQKTASLSSDEATLLWRSSFWAAHCYFYLSKFDEAIHRYGGLAIRNQGQIGELGALSQIFQCYVLTKQQDKAKATLARMRTAYDKMPDAAFTGADRTFQRTFWLEWFTDAAKQFPDT
jgi:TolA-binding protein